VLFLGLGIKSRKVALDLRNDREVSFYDQMLQAGEKLVAAKIVKVRFIILIDK
jgi:hypothetical protein